MTREEMIYALENYWYDFYKKNPDEPMGDIHAAVHWYHSLSDQHLLWEYNNCFN
jgi:hypothetical protein